MATKDGFDPDDSLPLFLSVDEPEQGIGNNKAVISLQGLTAVILAAATIGIGITILSNQVTLFADVTASPVDKSAPQPGTDQSTPTIQLAVVQSTADAEALPPTAKDAPTPETSAFEPASQALAEDSEASSDALFREFQAWAAEQDARALAKPIQADPAPVVENPPARVQKQRRARTIIRNARAEIRRGREARARVQNQPVQNAEAPSFLETLNPFAASPPQR
jgi:membrane-bound lytic murein transglycosylase